MKIINEPPHPPSYQCILTVFVLLIKVARSVKCLLTIYTSCIHVPRFSARAFCYSNAHPEQIDEKNESGPSLSGRILELFQKQCRGETSETGRSAYGLYRAPGYYPELNI